MLRSCVPTESSTSRCCRVYVRIPTAPTARKVTAAKNAARRTLIRCQGRSGGDAPPVSTATVLPGSGLTMGFLGCLRARAPVHRPRDPRAEPGSRTLAPPRGWRPGGDFEHPPPSMRYPDRGAVHCIGIREERMRVRPRIVPALLALLAAAVLPGAAHVGVAQQQPPMELIKVAELNALLKKG